MKFKDSIRSGFSNYANFMGRAQKSEYWFWVLFCWIIFSVWLVLESTIFSAAVINSSSGTGQIFMPVNLIFFALAIPTISVFVRRLHDTDRKGWWWLFSFVPFGGLVLFIWLCTNGTPGANRFGEEPSKHE